MRHLLKINIAFVFFVSLFSLSVSAQQGNTSIDTSYFKAVDAANYDSLLHNFYMKQYAETANKHRSRRATSAYNDFDNIPDTVFVSRLQKLHMVVPMTYNSDVRAYIRLYVRIMSRRLDAMLSLSEYYFPMFEEILDQYGVPEELKYLTIVESALNPQATSRAGAAGLWQFMYATGKGYGLEVNSQVDERRDPYKSTVAAARYLKALYDMYHDWHLAMAAYNCGPGNVNKAITRAGGKRTFWQIYPYLPRETRNYVPAYIGATYVLNYYHEHGLTAGKYEIPLRTDTIHLHKDVHFAIVQKIIGIPVEQLRQLNPQYRADVIPASSKTYAICLPSNMTSKFLKNEDSIYARSKDTISKFAVMPVATTNVIYHKVKKGETYNSIAQKYGVSVNSLKRWNGKSRRSTLKTGTRLKIHVPAKTESSNSESEQSKTTIETADKTGEQPADTVASANQEQTVAKTTTNDKKQEQAKQNKKKESSVYHKVKKGESLGTISRKYNTSVDKIKKLNNMKKDVIHPGQRLRVK